MFSGCPHMALPAPTSHLITVRSLPSAQQGAPRCCTPPQSRGWDRAAFPATLRVAVCCGCPTLPPHMTLPTQETLEMTRTCPHQGGYVPQTARVRVDGDV